ncbi:MAG: hypothetical protein LBK04_02555 [Clostridiales Family XIII bacterium]|jgi:hypothetical protein|nr:hypothetical protein [Clostridiales Family XIII bacterium]
MKRTIAMTGRTIEQQALEYAAEKTDGLPFLIFYRDIIVKLITKKGLMIRLYRCGSSGFDVISCRLLFGKEWKEVD